MKTTHLPTIKNCFWIVSNMLCTIGGITSQILDSQIWEKALKHIKQQTSLTNDEIRYECLYMLGNIITKSSQDNKVELIQSFNLSSLMYDALINSGEDTKVIKTILLVFS